MWSDEARAKALEARRAHSKHHMGKNGNREIAKKAKKDHSTAKGFIKGAGAGAVVGAAIGAAALHQYGGARIGAKLGAVAGAKTGAVIGAIHGYANRKRKGK